MPAQGWRSGTPRARGEFQRSGRGTLAGWRKRPLFRVQRHGWRAQGQPHEPVDLLARQQKAKDVPDFVYRSLEQAGQRLLKENKALETREETVAGIADSIVRYNETFAPVLANLGIQ